MNILVGGGLRLVLALKLIQKGSVIVLDKLLDQLNTQCAASLKVLFSLLDFSF